ncbi:MAG: universal stress protein [Longimicrobiaceae bacterium]
MRSVLVGSDLGPRSDAVVRGAAALALASGAVLHVVHALGLVGRPLREAVTALEAGADPRARRALEEQVGRVLGEDVDRALPAVDYRSAPVALLERAREVDADVVVVGAGEDPAGTVFHVASRSTRPVLVLRGAFRWPPGSVLYPVDEPDASGGGLRHACDWLRRACPAPSPRVSPAPAGHLLDRAGRSGTDLLLLHRRPGGSIPPQERAWYQALLRSPCPVCLLPGAGEQPAPRADAARARAPEDGVALAAGG